ncbi:MAG: Eco57I restriction-modification methylase domain-containing protein [Bacteroidetes bacterium]|nr:Eco57I restriction-modification methylase domain-containing protein [Bacteroidota bacterium]
METNNYNPDVLSCLANLSNDEVFTPPGLVNEILDLLPIDIWKDKNAKFLDPVSKSGVFLREIAKRLLSGLESQIPEKQERVNHILTNQIYGIAITELTSLISRRSVYCSKKANEKYSICDKFKDEQGNIIYEKMFHTWENGNCKFCGASQDVYDREITSETYAYPFLHTDITKKIFKNMKFDVIIGNPPYQLNDGGGTGMSAKPIYHKFIEQAKKLNPRFLSMIIPARWYSGGKGLDEFRASMISDTRMKKIVDFENSNEIFPGVDVAGGICYFLWERDYNGVCEFVNSSKGVEFSSSRYLNEFSTIIRHSRALSIIRKVQQAEGSKGKYLDLRISTRKPFGLASNYTPAKNGIPCHFTQRQGMLFAKSQDVIDTRGYLNKWKLLIPFAPIAGQTDFSKPIGFYYDGNTRIAKPGECCSESWLVACSFNTKAEVLSFKSYLFTKFARFLLLQNVVSQNVTRGSFSFIPDLIKYEGEYTDELLRQRYSITDDEWVFIDSKIRDIGINSINDDK